MKKQTLNATKKVLKQKPKKRKPAAANAPAQPEPPQQMALNPVEALAIAVTHLSNALQTIINRVVILEHQMKARQRKAPAKKKPAPKKRGK